MDIRPLRSPIYVVLTAPSGAVSAKLELTIDSTLRYTIIKDCTAGSTVTFEIAELAKDYIQTPQCWTIGGVSTFFANSTQIEITRAVKFYDAANAGGSQVGSTNSDTFNGFDGYGEWVEGANSEIPKGAKSVVIQENAKKTILRMSPARWGHPDGCPPAWAARNVISAKK